MPFPPAHLLVGAAAADLAATLTERPPPRWKVWLVGALAGVLPDADLAVSLLLTRSGAYHGIFTHSLLAVAAIALLAALLAGGRWGLLVGAGYASHLLIDVLEAQSGSSVQLLWPWSEATVPSLAPVFPAVAWQRGEGVVSAALSLLELRVLAGLLGQTLVALAIFVVLVRLGPTLRARWRATSWAEERG